MALRPASSEQQIIIDSLDAGSNAIADSVAGAGKTTTVLHIARRLIEKNIVLLTYNTRLKLETRKRRNDLGINNLEVQTYHAFGSKYYGGDCHNDDGVNAIVNRKMEPTSHFAFDVVIIDELQDMTPLLYRLVFKIVQDNHNKDPLICLLGDRNQSIYSFNGADPRFIVHASRLFRYVNTRPFREVQLKTSFRITRQMADFLNVCVLRHDRVTAIKDGRKVRYIVCDGFGGQNSRAIREVMSYLTQYGWDDIFILAPSVRGEGSPVRRLANALTERGINIHVPISDEERLDDDVLKSKVVFSTFHQAKGLERKVVIVFGFDDTYFKYYKRDVDPTICPNEMYVALTRASERLTVLHHYQNDYIPFLDRERMKDHCECILDFYPPSMIESKKDQAKMPEHEPETEIGVTDLLRHLPYDVLTEARKYITMTRLQEPATWIDIPVKTVQGHLYENVSEITGIAIPSYFELLRTGKMTIYRELEMFYGLHQILNDLNECIKTQDQKLLENMGAGRLRDIREDIGTMTPESLLYLANYYVCHRTKYTYKIRQIVEYGWLSEENLVSAVDRLGTVISPHAEFERKGEVRQTPELGNRRLKGFIDCVDGDRVYELKCVQELTGEHFLQLALYNYLLASEREIELDRRAENVRAEIKSKTRRIDTLKKAVLLVPGREVTFEADGDVKRGKISHLFMNGRVNVRVDGKVFRTSRSVINREAEAELGRLEEGLRADEVQLAGILDMKLAGDRYSYYLFNIISGELWEVRSNLNDLKKLVSFLVSSKYNLKKMTSDERFILSMTDLLTSSATVRAPVEDAGAHAGADAGADTGPDDEPRCTNTSFMF